MKMKKMNKLKKTIKKKMSKKKNLKLMRNLINQSINLINLNLKLNRKG
jgi:hypothetical protein